MIEKEDIVYMIENLDHLVDDAKRDLDERILYLGLDSISEIAAAEQLRAKIYGAIGGGKGNLIKDMSDIYEMAVKKQNAEEKEIIQEIFVARERYFRAWAFSRIFNQDLTGFQQSVLIQKHKEKRKLKAMEWNGRQLTRYEVDKACYEGIARLQRQMEREGFKN